MRSSSITTRRASLAITALMLVATIAQYNVFRIGDDDNNNNDNNKIHATSSPLVKPLFRQQNLQQQNSSNIRRKLQLQKDIDAGTTTTTSEYNNESFQNHFGLIFPTVEKMPLHLRNTMDALHEGDVVLFWHIPKSAGQLMKVIMGTCFGLRRAERLKEPASLEYVRDVVVNVDTQTPQGIYQAQELGLIESGMVDLITSPHVISASSLFTFTRMGRAFTILHHPVLTAFSKFEDRKKIRSHLKELTLAEYATKDYYPDNWMTRQLTGILPEQQLTEEHAQRARNLLMSKFFVGIADQMEETVRQVRLYYGWITPPGKEKCVREMVRGDTHCPGADFSKNAKKKSSNAPERGGKEWNIVAEREKWDMGLYFLALEMFSRQHLMLDALDQSKKPQSFW